MQKTAESLLNACTTLESGPPALLEHLATAYASVPESPAAAEVAKITAELNGFVKVLHGGHTMLNDILALLRGMHSDNTAALETFKARDVAFEEKGHYDAKHNKLQEDLTKKPNDSKLAAKVVQSELQQKENEESFNQAMQEAQSVADATIAKQYSGTEAAVAKMCRFYLLLGPEPTAFESVRQFAERYDKPVTPVVSIPAK